MNGRPFSSGMISFLKFCADNNGPVYRDRIIELHSAAMGDANNLGHTVYSMEAKGYMTVMRRAIKSRNHVECIFVTPSGKNYLHQLEQDARDQKESKHLENRRPCGMNMKICYSGEKCYLSYKCGAAVGQTFAKGIPSEPV